MSICSPHECAYCRSPIELEERWVREKVYEPALDGHDPSYRRYHADAFAGQEVSCWVKHQMEQEISRVIVCAA